MEPLARDISALVDHVKNLLQRMKYLENYVSDVAKHLNQETTAEITAQNPLMHQSYVDIVRITAASQVDGTWTGVRQRVNNFGNLEDCTTASAPITGYKGAATSLPSVGSKVPVMFLGKEAGFAPASSHVLLSQTSSGSVDAAVGTAEELIPGATGCPDACTPGTGSVVVEFGSGYSGTVDSCENWSYLSISKDQWVVLLKIDGHNVIITAFC